MVLRALVRQPVISGRLRSSDRHGPTRSRDQFLTETALAIDSRSELVGRFTPETYMMCLWDGGARERRKQKTPVAAEPRIAEPARAPLRPSRRSRSPIDLVKARLDRDGRTLRARRTHRRLRGWRRIRLQTASRSLVQMMRGSPLLPENNGAGQHVYVGWVARIGTYVAPPSSIQSRLRSPDLRGPRVVGACRSKRGLGISVAP